MAWLVFRLEMVGRDFRVVLRERQGQMLDGAGLADSWGPKARAPMMR